MRRVICLALLAVSVPAHAEMMCESGPMPAQGVSAQTTVAGSGGVIVVGNTLPDWRFRDVNRVVRPRVTKVAPGLALYHPRRSLIQTSRSRTPITRRAFARRARSRPIHRWRRR